MTACSIVARTDGRWATTPAYKAVLEESRLNARLALKSAEGQPGS